MMVLRVAARHLRAAYEKLFKRIDSWPSIPQRPSSVDYVSVEEVFSHPPVRAIFGFSKKRYLKLAVETKVPAKDIWPTQPQLIRDGLKNYILRPPMELPLVVRYTDGRLFAQDHTRIAAQILRGASMVAVRLIDYTGNSDEPYSKPLLKR
jgi:hypothetical protein